MAVRWARGAQVRPERVPRCGFVANGSAFCDKQVCILWRTLCAATGGTGFGVGRTKCRDRSGEHCSPWPFDGRVPRRGFVANGAAFLWRTLCAATGARVLAQVRGFAADGAAILWRTMCAATGGTGFGVGRTKCRDRSGEHCSPWPFDGRAGTCAPPRLCGERVRILWRTMCAATGGCGFRRRGPRCRGERVRILQRTGPRRGLIPATPPG